MKLNQLAENKDLKDLRGYDDWSVDLNFLQGNVLFPYEVVITNPEGDKFQALGGTGEEAYRNARHKAKI
jgi:hypothetical protein